MEQGEVKRIGRGRPEQRPGRVVGDKAYSSRKIRRYSRRRGIRISIPRRQDECRTGLFDKVIYHTRYERRAENFRAMWIVAATLLSLWFEDTP